MAVAGHMLRMMRDHGVRDQMLFSLPQFRFQAAGRKAGEAVGKRGGDGRTDEATAIAGREPGQPRHGRQSDARGGERRESHARPAAGNDGVRLNGAHEIDAYAFRMARLHGLIIFNYGLHQARRISLEAPGLSARC